MDQIVDRLWELQTALTELAGKEKLLQEKPDEYAAVEKELNESQAAIDRLEQKLEESSRQRRKSEAELQDAQEVLKKFQGQLMQVKNQQQYSAAWKEIDVARKTVKDLEDATFGSLSEIESTEKELGEKREAHASIRERHDRAYEQWQGSLGDLKREADAIRARVESIESRIPDPLRRQFHQILRQRQGVAMSRVSGDACGECRVRLRAQSIQQLKRGEVVTCDGCRRFYYLDKVAS